jgi:ferredoxin-NADP reductase
MARATVRGRLSWQVATVSATIEETPRVRTLVLDCPSWPGHLAGQHIDLRLTAEDGYQAQRSYSLAVPDSGTEIAITVERVQDGEVSPYLVDDVRVGDRMELRGPIGGYFVWRAEDGGPLQLIAGGSGLVPLMAMLRARVAAGSDVPVRVLISARTEEDLMYGPELEGIERDQTGIEVTRTLTRSQPTDWTGYRRRVDRELLDSVVWPAADEPVCFICGPTGFVETVASALVDLGHQPESIRTERFGPSGGQP